MAKRNPLSAPKARGPLIIEWGKPAPEASTWLSAVRDEPPFSLLGVERKLAIEALAALKAGDVDTAMMLARDIGRLLGAHECYVMIEEILSREHLRKNALRFKVKARLDEKASLACQLWAEYDPADVKRVGKKNVRREIGEIMQRRLKLPKPIPAETVRDYLKGTKTGEP